MVNLQRVGVIMFNEEIYTVEEVAKHLRVPVGAVEKEIASGRLHATQVGDYLRIRESDLNAFKNGPVNPSHSSRVPARSLASVVLDGAPNFSHTWPDKKIEHFSSVREGVVTDAGTNYHVKVGFTTRDSAGKNRRRSLVLINRYPSVEFVSADANGSGLMASIIRDRTGKQLPVGAVVPPEYEELRVGGYRDIVIGPSAPNGLAVICDPLDVETMARHGLIRYRYREERNQNRKRTLVRR
jgi:excisionase family DNA binding protein